MNRKIPSLNTTLFFPPFSFWFLSTSTSWSALVYFSGVQIFMYTLYVSPLSLSFWSPYIREQFGVNTRKH